MIVEAILIPLVCGLVLSLVLAWRYIDSLKRHIELLGPDAALGALVRGMPAGWHFWRDKWGFWLVRTERYRDVGCSKEPEAALEEALPKEDDDERAS